MKFTPEKWAEMYRKIYTIRTFETRCIQLYRQGFITGYFHPYLGEEAIAVGACAALRDDDYIISTHRGHGHCIARNGQLKKMVAEVLGKETGYCRGRGGSMHIADIDTGNMGANGIVGAGIPLGVGAAMGIKIRKTDQAVIIFFSDGASNNGVFAESLNLAAIWDLPAVFMLENNQYAVSTPIQDSARTEHLYQRAAGYGVAAEMIDGNDVKQVHETTLKALDMCRSGHGPYLVEAVTYRHSGHHVNDPGTYMPRDKLDYYKAKDPVTVTRQYLIDEAGFTPQQVDELNAAVEEEMAEAVKFAMDSPEPSVEAFMEEVSCQ